MAVSAPTIRQPAAARPAVRRRSAASAAQKRPKRTAAARRRFRFRLRVRAAEVQAALLCVMAAALFAGVCSAVHLAGVVRLASVSSTNSALAASVRSQERANDRARARLDALLHPDRLIIAAQGQGMMPADPSAHVLCPPPARMAEAAGSLSDERLGWR